MCSLLLTSGADINAQTRGKQTALHLAASNSNSKETLEVLLMTRAVDHSLKNSVGETSKELAERTCKYHYLFEIADPAINELSS
jgi:ankyrin repeat protein